MFNYKEYIYAIYLKKSFSRAAEMLYISQPALSNIVKKVEDELSVTLFDRSKNPIELTEDGKFYIEQVKKVMLIEKETKDYFDSSTKLHRDVITIGAPTFFCAYVLPPFINAFRQDYPQCKINLVELNAEDLLKALESGAIDLSIDVDIIESSSVHTIKWYEEHIILAVPKEFSVNETIKEDAISYEDIKSRAYLDDAYPSVDFNKLENVPLILLRRGNDMHERALRTCKNAGFYPNIFMQVDQLLTSYYLAKLGKGAVFIRDTILDYEKDDGDLCFYKFKNSESSRYVSISYRKITPLSKSAKLFLSFLQESIE